MQQLSLEENKDLIETTTIAPTKKMPLDVFKEYWRLSYFMELMERVDEDHVIWDEDVESTFSMATAEAEYYALQNDMFSMPMEVPKDFHQKIIE